MKLDISTLNPIMLIPPKYRFTTYTITSVIIALLLFGGGYKFGYYNAKNHYTAIIAKMERDVAVMEKNIAQLAQEKAELQTKLQLEISNVKERIITKYVDRVKIIKQKEYVYREQATNIVPDTDELSNGWVLLHDAAARNTDADSTGVADGTASGIKANQALAVVAENYAACNANAEQLSALQTYIRDVEKIVRETNDNIKKKT